MIDKKGCIKVLQIKITQIKTFSKSLQTEIENLAQKKYNIDYGVVIDIFNNILPIENQPYHLLYKIMVVIKEAIVNKNVQITIDDLNVNKYFTELEIEEFELPIPKKESNYDIVIKSGNWHLTDIFPHRYITIHTDANEVIRWRDYNKLRFNPKTQRDLLIVETNGVEIYKLDLNPNSIKSMTSDMPKGEYFDVPGILNINPELNEEDIIFAPNGDLIIPESIKIDLIEGFYNYKAVTDTKDKNKDWNFPCEYRIYFLNTQRANQVINQMDKKNHLKPAQKKRLDINDPITFVVNTMMNDARFYLKNTINESMYSYLYDLLSKTFNIERENIKQKALLVEKLINKVNMYILQTDHFEKPLSKEEWFLVIYLIKNLNEETYNSVILDKELTQEIIKKLDIKNNPTSTHYNIIRNFLEEEI